MNKETLLSGRKVHLWRYAAGILFPVEGAERLIELHRWRYGQNGCVNQWFVDAPQACIVVDPVAIEWNSFTAPDVIDTMRSLEPTS
ncbi:MAG: hypothetical protein ABJE95_39290 [Byssovorax sp.]